MRKLLLGLIGVGASVVMSASAVGQAAKTVGVGDLMFREELREPLPNAFGRPDIFGRKRTIGYTELRYLGLDEEGRAKFSRREVSVITNENTANRSGLTIGTIRGDGNSATYVGTKVAGPNVSTVPPSDFAIILDMKADRELLINGHSLQVVEATSSRVTFIPPTSR